jgi:hypothetical protein
MSGIRIPPPRLLGGDPGKIGYARGLTCPECGMALPDWWEFPRCYWHTMMSRQPYPRKSHPGYVPWKYIPTRRVAEWLMQQPGYEKIDVALEAFEFQRFYHDSLRKTVDVDGAFIEWLKPFFGGKA